MLRQVIKIFRIGKTVGTIRFSTEADKKKRARKFLMELLGSSRGVSTKVGQFLSLGNGDSDLTDAFKESVPPMSREEVVQVLNQNYAGDYRTVFKKLDWQARAASLGQVHRAVLTTGEKVAVKVRYAGIDGCVEDELKLLGWLPNMGPVRKWGMDFGDYVEEFRVHFKEELDYRLEADRQLRYESCARAIPGIVVPHVYKEQCRDGVLVQSWEEGMSLENACSLNEEQRQGLGKIFLTHYLHMLFREGLLHSDPNPDNFAFVAKKNRLQVILYDFGSLFEIGPTQRLILLRIILALRYREALDPMACLAGLGFDTAKLNDLKPQLPALLEVLFEPFNEDAPVDLADWDLNRRWDEIAGELKWWFRSAAPPSALFLMRSLHGLATHLRSLDARLSWRWILDEVAGDLYREVRELSIPALVPANGSGAVTFSGLSRYLKVHVEKGNGNRVSLTMPARVVDSLEEVIDPPVLESIKKNEIDLDEVKAKVQKSGYAPQTLFEVQDPERMVQVWLE